MPMPGPADDLTSHRMSRVRAALILFVAVGMAALGTLAGATEAGAAPPASPPPTSVAAAAVAPATTLPPAGSRGGADEGSVVKPSHESWGVQQIIVTTALVVIALAAIGYVYGKVRSAPPKHPDLSRQPEDLEATG
jgi:hypothetical protein